MTSSRRRLLRTKFALAITLAAGIGLAGPAFLMVSRKNSPLLRAAVEAATTDSMTLTSPVRLPSVSGVVLEQGRLGLSGARNGQSRDGAATQTLLDTGRADLVLSDAVFSIDPAQFGKPAAPPLDASIGPLLATVAGLSFDQLRISNATVIVRRSDGGREVLTNVNAEVIASRKSSVKASGSLRYLGEPLLFEATLSNPAEIRPGARLPLVLKLKGPLLEGDIDGTLVLAEQPQLVSTRSRLTVLDVPSMARLFGIAWPERATIERFDARGKLVWAGRSIAIDDATFTFDDNKATGALALSLTGKRPLLDATLAFAKLDVGRYLDPPVAPSGQAHLMPNLNGLFASSQASAAQPVAVLDAELRVSAEAIVGLPFKLGRFATTLSSKGGQILADITGFEAQGCNDGRAEISIALNEPQPRTVLTGHCDEFDIASASTLLVGHAPLEGLGSADVELTATGRTAAEIQSTLAGKLDLSISSGARIGVSVPTLAADKRLKTAGLVESPSWGRTPVDTLRARLTAKDGIFRLAEFDAAVGEEHVLAAGTLSLPARVMDVTFRTAKPSDQGLQKGADPVRAFASSASSASAIRILGPWANPFVRPATDADAPSGTPSEFPLSRTPPAPLGPPAE